MLFFLPALSNLAIVISFKINQDYIAKTLCEKKEVKENTCNGHCHLKKELKKVAETETESTLPELHKEKTELVQFESDFTFSFYPKSSKKSSFSFYKESNLTFISKAIFHPPIC